jgi:DNA helicase TIP49 (TBP-interacting protein)
MFLEMEGISLTTRQNNVFSSVLKMMSLVIGYRFIKRVQLLDVEILSYLNIKPLKALNRRKK